MSLPSTVKLQRCGRTSNGRRLLVVVAALLFAAGCDLGGESDPSSAPSVPAGVPTADDGMVLASTGEDEVAAAPAPTTTVAPIPAPTTTPAPAPTTTVPAPTTTLPPDPLESLVEGECVGGLGLGEDLFEIACGDPKAEGLVIRAARSAEIDCATDVTQTRRVTDSSGTAKEFGFCIDFLPPDLTAVFALDELGDACRAVDVDTFESASQFCDMGDHAIYFVRLEPGTNLPDYFGRYSWDATPERVGTWGTKNVDVCGEVIEATHGVNSYVMYTFDQADYVIWFTSSRIGGTDLRNVVSFSFPTSACS